MMLGSLLPEEFFGCFVPCSLFPCSFPSSTPLSRSQKRKRYCYIRVHCRRYASNDGQAWVDAWSPPPPQDVKITLSSEHDPLRNSSPSLLLEVEELSDEDLKALAEQLEIQKLNQSASSNAVNKELKAALDTLAKCRNFTCLKGAYERLKGKTKFNFPHFFLIGWQKCATTSINNYLRRHPQYLPSPIKEPHFFTACQANSSNPMCNVESKEEYILNFLRLNDAVAKSLGAATVDASVDYAWKGEALARKLYRLFPWLKIVMVMREPISRMISYTRMYTLRGHRIKGCQVGQTLYECLRWRFDVEDSHYDKALEGWLKVFPTEQVLVMQFEELQEDIEGQLRKLKDFLGLDPELPKYRFNNVNRKQNPEGYPITRQEYQELIDAVQPHAERALMLLEGKGLANTSAWMMRWMEIWQQNLEACDPEGNCRINSK